MTNEESVNSIIQLHKKYSEGFDVNKISDGYHMFGELYEHRVVLFIALCKQLSYNEQYDYDIWKRNPVDGWFLMGIELEKGKQISYHLPVSKWEETDCAKIIYDKDYEYDGHTSADVLQRLKNL